MSNKRSASTSPIAMKKARTESNPNTPKESREGSKELTRGAKWMIAQIDRMQGHHQICLQAVTAIIQYRTYAKQLRIRNPQIPPALLDRLQRNWEAYECIRRHIEWYMTQNALHASTPSRPPPPATSPLASMHTPLTSIQTQDLPKASPIPLSSSIMAYDTQIDPIASLPPIPNPGVPTVPGPKPIPAFTTSDPLNLGGNGLDLSSLGVDELSAFLNSSTDPNAFGTDAGDDFIAGLFSEPGTEMSQAETDRLLSSLAGPPGQVSAGATGDFNFDFGATDGAELDMSELVGLFDNNDQPEVPQPATAPTNQAIDAPAVVAGTNLPASIQPSSSANNTGEGAQPQTDGGHKKRPSIGVGSTPVHPSETTQPAVKKPELIEPAPAAQNTAPAQTTQAQTALDQAMASLGDGQEYDLSNIDLDDFNFGDVSIPNVEGDEFESLFAEFK